MINEQKLCLQDKDGVLIFSDHRTGKYVRNATKKDICLLIDRSIEICVERVRKWG
jgi:hypothetical protein